jgi:hypothetical protein
VNTCLLCQKAQPGDTYTAVAANGMRLEKIFVCNACSAASQPENACAVCKKPVGPDRPAERYEGVSASGRALTRKTVCTPCAVHLGPRQGLTESFKEEIRRGS